MSVPMTRRKFLRQTAALIATGILPIASVRATWEKLPPEPEEASPPDKRFLVTGLPSEGSKPVWVGSREEHERLFGSNGGDIIWGERTLLSERPLKRPHAEFERALMKIIMEEFDRSLDGYLLQGNEAFIPYEITIADVRGGPHDDQA